MRVTEIFYSVQGEGINVGKPSIFIRLTGCNMLPICDFCDTKYAMEEGKQMVLCNIIEEVEKYPCKHLVFTGGEPSLQIKDIDLLLSKLGCEYTREIETNGLILLPEAHFDLITVSPKKQKFDEYVLTRYNTFDNIVFKFVIGNREDFIFWRNLIERLNLNPEKVIMMPEGIDDDRLKMISRWLVDRCKDHNYRFSPRLQIWLYGNRRGV